ncbi:ATP-binding protein [Streptomyces pactum]|uniref:ATP-binding protein n=1 Tax=Streptomyces pactum TaxID=68249 RepID=A0ABS0NKN2_9ACTN|nr:ATP-binding protein [Streptomyces pactum]MBH5335754.1 ATP-binding protein [Streptomyces pactum]
MGTNGSTMLEPLWRGLPPVGPSAVSGSASCALPARYEAVKGARRFTGRTLDQWELPDLFDDVALVVSELVTNALRHALPQGVTPDGPGAAAGPLAAGSPSAGSPVGVRPPGAPVPPGPDPARATDSLVRLHLMRWTTRLVCAVRDPSEASPVAGEADFSQESGRGLHLVESFSDSWGWHPLGGTLRGKVVWAQFRLTRD